MFSKAKVGDKAWDFRLGWGEISNIYNDTVYPLLVTFNVGRNSFKCMYTYKGLKATSDINPSLFWQEFEIPEKAFQKPLPKLEVDTKVIVWQDYSPKFKRYFKRFNEDGKIVTFQYGKTSWSSNTTNEDTWSNWGVAK